MTSIILLFVVLTAPDGSKSVKDLAVFADEGICALTANVLNESPRKASDLHFSCRVGKPAVQS